MTENETRIRIGEAAARPGTETGNAGVAARTRRGRETERAAAGTGIGRETRRAGAETGIGRESVVGTRREVEVRRGRGVEVRKREVVVKIGKNGELPYLVLIFCFCIRISVNIKFTFDVFHC